MLCVRCTLYVVHRGYVRVPTAPRLSFPDLEFEKDRVPVPIKFLGLFDCVVATGTRRGGGGSSHPNVDRIKQSTTGNFLISVVISSTTDLNYPAAF